MSIHALQECQDELTWLLEKFPTEKPSGPVIASFPYGWDDVDMHYDDKNKSVVCVSQGIANPASHVERRYIVSDAHVLQQAGFKTFKEAIQIFQDNTLKHRQILAQLGRPLPSKENSLIANL